MSQQDIGSENEIKNNIVIDVKSQKEIIDHSFKQSFKFMIYTFILIVPIILIITFALIYSVRFFISS